MKELTCKYSPYYGNYHFEGKSEIGDEVICSSFVKDYFKVSKLPEIIKIKIYNRNPKRKGTVRVEKTDNMNSRVVWVTVNGESMLAYTKLIDKMNEGINFVILEILDELT